MSAYITALRLRTLFLSAAGICLGGGIAASQGFFDTKTFLLTLLTAVSLQIVSNLANELGDFQKGTDNSQRTGPIRGIQQGKMSEKQLRTMLFLWVAIAAISGLMMLFVAFDSFWNPTSITLLCIGGLAILAAIFYTIGKKAYGYHGWGDVFVFLFFGIVSVVGSHFLQTKQLDFGLLLPASAVGFLSVAVLNLNNLRDIDNDRHCHKNTLVVKMGEQNARRYHAALILAAFVVMLIFTILRYRHIENFGFLLLLPVFVYHIRYVFGHKGRDLDKHFPLLVMGTFVMVLLFCTVLIW